MFCYTRYQQRMTLADRSTVCVISVGSRKLPLFYVDCVSDEDIADSTEQTFFPENRLTKFRVHVA